MMSGVVNRRLEAIVPVILVGHNGRRVKIEAVIDTGFTGFLTINRTIAVELGFTKRGQVRAQLADGSEALLDVFKAVVESEGQLRYVDADLVEGCSLVGMRLLLGHHLSMHVVQGGRVEVRPEKGSTVS